jgi:predicted dehydrogenase
MRAMADGSPTLNVGVIGCGGIACQYHLKILRRAPGVEVLAVADPRPQARARAVDLTGADAHETAGELLAREDVGAVVICAENRVHAELACAAAEAGKHFYLEKPLALSLADGRRVVAAASSAGVRAAIGYQFRDLPLYLGLRRRLAEGKLGRVRAIRTRYCEPFPVERMPSWKRRRESGGGALLDLGTHHFDLAAWLLGDEIEAIEEARIESERSEHDEAWLRGRMSSGAELEAEFSYRRGRICDWQFDCEHGTLAVDRHDRLARLLARPRRRRRTQGAVSARIRALPIPRREPSFGLSLTTFCERLRGKPRETASLEDGLRSLEVVLETEAVAGAA